MVELSDVDKSKISAETASVNRTKALKLVITEVMERVEKQDGVGLRPEEVWCLLIYIFDLELKIDKLNQDIIINARLS